MKIKSLLIVLAVFACSYSYGQNEAVADTSWKSGGLFSLGFQQVSLENWAAGGLNSVSGNGLLSLYKNYAKGTVSWDNTLDLGYGLLKQGEGDAVKSDDRIDLASKFGKQAWSDKWYWSVLGNVRTQFTEGLSAPDTLGNTSRISDFFAPAYGLLALGLDYKPNEDFTLFISPVTAKFTYVGVQELADAGAFGVEGQVVDPVTNLITSDGENLRSEFGAYLKAAYKKQLVENISLMTKLDLFTNYEENPFTRTDVAWDLLLGMKVNKYISANIGLTALYDHDIDIVDSDGNVGPRTQIRELFGLGFNYEF